MSLTETAAPPHPFRTPAWFDPRLEHRPCMCPRCRRPDGAGPRLRPVRIGLVVVGGVLWPLAALLVNTHFHVVGLGVVGTCALLLAGLSALANLVLLPTRRDRFSRQVLTEAPRASWLRVLLLVGAAHGCLAWGYLSLLMLPLLPISAVTILFFGLGLCGFTPFLALAVALVQLPRAARAVGERLGRRRAALLVVLGLLAPPLLGAAAGLLAWRRQVRLEAQLEAVARQAPHSEERLQAVAGLTGSAERLPALLPQLHELELQRAAAEAYLLLTDRRINEAAARAGREQQVLIRPLWFLDGHRSSPMMDGFLLSRFLRF